MSDLAKMMADDAAADGKHITKAMLNNITKLAQAQLLLQQQVQEAEEALKSLKGQLAQVQEKDLPEAMKEVGMTQFKLADGTKIEISSDVYPNIKAANQAKVFKWFEDNGHGSLLKDTFTLEAKGTEAAEQLRAALDEANLLLLTKEKFGIHPQTLKAFVREQLRDGGTLPDGLDYHEASKAKIAPAT